MRYEYKTENTCSQSISFDINDKNQSIGINEMHDMNIEVRYYTRSGNTKKLADALNEVSAFAKRVIGR